MSKRRRNGQFSGTADIQGGGHSILPGGVGMPEQHSAGTVQGCDIVDLCKCPLLGSRVKARPHYLPGVKEGALGYEQKGDSSHPTRACRLYAESGPLLWKREEPWHLERKESLATHPGEVMTAFLPGVEVAESRTQSLQKCRKKKTANQDYSLWCSCPSEWKERVSWTSEG